MRTTRAPLARPALPVPALPAATAPGAAPGPAGRSHRTARPALAALSLGYFTLGTASLAVVGLGGPIGRDLHTAPGGVGVLVAVFALTFALAAPLAPAVLGRLDRRRALLLGLALMAAGGVLGALAPSYAVLVGARVLAGLGGAVFGPASSAVGSLIVPEEHRPRALATVFAGMTVAAVLGVPLSAYLGGAVGWRWTLAGIAAATLLALVLVAALVPAVPAGEPPTAAAYRRVLATPGAAATVLTTLLYMAAQFTVYGVAGGYVAARFGASPSAVTLVLFAFGLCGVAGNACGARLSARLGGARTVTLTQAGLAAAFLGLLAAPRALPAAVLLFALWAFFSQLYQAPQQARLIALAPGQRGLLLALNASMLYVGISLGSLLAGTFLPVLGAGPLPALGLLPLALAGLAHRASVRRTVRSTPAPSTAGTDREGVTR
ncbi:MFS transporter [Kitasatospora herbaricolor]|uniref:MFS transporter n=1 Tax=Kitasatospora herbaricolor TaxID=68217 RepID=UPI00174C6927|nr:MFS transporter [Kitasatospora herbaricolor]MDQ0308170.1 DHA1 family inner membrane transport protein [Kitasatospora herbaricolor]GGV05792.1 MFS transporter [Kitasatospora herbaricolor]